MGISLVGSLLAAAVVVVNFSAFASDSVTCAAAPAGVTAGCCSVVSFDLRVSSDLSVDFLGLRLLFDAFRRALFSC